jgi:3-hydroxybutyrate dehydrogenase/3-oxoacyl-[acyl-carrier protein] reductase
MAPRQDRPIALVTGASSGTGLEVARGLAGAGYDLAILGRREAALDALREDLATQGTACLKLVCDVTDDAALRLAMARFLDWCAGRVDVLVNAAGIPGSVGVNIGDVALASFEQAWLTNLRAPFIIMSALLPAMYARAQGRVINIGGNHAMRGRAGRAPYSASKWGLRGLTHTAALEAGPHGVTVNFIAPGPIAIDRMRQNWRRRAEQDGVDEAAALKTYMQGMGAALGRPSEAADIVAMVLFLIGPGGRNITGQDLVIDGGIIV